MERLLIYIYVFSVISCTHAQDLKVGAERTSEYLPLLNGKNIGLVVNQTSIVGDSHLVDTLLSYNIAIKSIFAPEHGFRGDADAGELVKNGKDTKTGLPIISLYGKNKKPNSKQLEGIDVIIFDIQDVGVRFYTYISTMHYMMEACAENDIDFIVLDRPNPNGHYIDGPVLEAEYKSFVGMHPIPVVHGLTVGELAQMINGEGWLKDQAKCKLTIIEVKGWTHDAAYSLPVKPSPNLPNDVAINLYPSLCFFEPTAISIGRGTHFPFQVFGSIHKGNGDFTFTPKSIAGMSKYPKHESILCYGQDLRQAPQLSQINLEYLVSAYQNYPNKEAFFTNPDFFNLLAGNKTLQKQLINGATCQEIRETWKNKLDLYQISRKTYLIYQ